MAGTYLIFQFLIYLLQFKAVLSSVEECYECYYMDHNEIPPFDFPSFGSYKPDASCRSGKKPNKSLIASCASLAFQNENDTGGNFSGDHVHPNSQNGGQLGFACVKAYFHGKEIHGKFVKATARTCIPWPGNQHLEERCVVKTLGELIDSVPPEVAQALGALLIYVDESASGTFCTCNSNACNNSPSFSHILRLQNQIVYTFLIFCVTHWIFCKTLS